MKHNWMQAAMAAVIVGITGCALEDSAIQKDLLNRRMAQYMAQATQQPEVAAQLFQLVGQQPNSDLAGLVGTESKELEKSIYGWLGRNLSSNCMFNTELRQIICPFSEISTEALEELGPLGEYLLGLQEENSDAQLLTSELPGNGVQIQVVDEHSSVVFELQVTDNELSSRLREKPQGKLMQHLTKRKAKTALLNNVPSSELVSRSMRVDGIELNLDEWDELVGLTDNKQNFPKLWLNLRVFYGHASHVFCPNGSNECFEVEVQDETGTLDTYRKQNHKKRLAQKKAKQENLEKEQKEREEKLKKDTQDEKDKREKSEEDARTELLQTQQQSQNNILHARETARQEGMDEENFYQQGVDAAHAKCAPDLPVHTALQAWQPDHPTLEMPQRYREGYDTEYTKLRDVDHTAYLEGIDEENFYQQGVEAARAKWDAGLLAHTALQAWRLTHPTVDIPQRYQDGYDAEYTKLQAARTTETQRLARLNGINGLHVLDNSTAYQAAYQFGRAKYDAGFTDGKKDGFTTGNNGYSIPVFDAAFWGQGAAYINYDKEKRIGYQNGYTHNTGYPAGRAKYDAGFIDGRTTGYSNGYNGKALPAFDTAFWSQSTNYDQEKRIGYKRGYMDATGHAAGKAKYDNGFADGKKDGFTTGNNGYSIPVFDAAFWGQGAAYINYDKEKRIGYQNGYTHNTGYPAGRAKYDAGFIDGRTTGYSNGYNGKALPAFDTAFWSQSTNYDQEKRIGYQAGYTRAYQAAQQQWHSGYKNFRYNKNILTAWNQAVGTQLQNPKQVPPAFQAGYQAGYQAWYQAGYQAGN